MLSSLSVLCRAYLAFVAFCLLGSLFSQLARLDAGLIAPLASAVTLMVGFLAVFEPIWRGKDKRFYWMLAIALFAASLVEILGVLTGYPFGRYAYTDRWQPAIRIESHWFPVLLPIAWMLVVGASYCVCSRFRYPIVCGALLATAVDFVMEPVMTGPLGYWRWAGHGPLPGGASLLNPVGWFVTSCLIGFILARTPTDYRRVAATVLAAHVALTLGIGAIAMIPR